VTGRSGFPVESGTNIFLNYSLTIWRLDVCFPPDVVQVLGQPEGLGSELREKLHVTQALVRKGVRFFSKRLMVQSVCDSGLKPGSVWRSVFLGALFVSGLLLQLVGPHLKITNNRFVLPPSLVSAGKDIHPDAIVARERTKQVLSGLLTLGGATGLALCHRKALFGRQSSQRNLVGKSNVDPTEHSIEM
jgi:hypothetical protein